LLDVADQARRNGLRRGDAVRLLRNAWSFRHRVNGTAFDGGSRIPRR
jgi:hypothetical protein